MEVAEVMEDVECDVCGEKASGKKRTAGGLDLCAECSEQSADSNGIRCC